MKGDRITEQDILELREAGYFPYSSVATAAGVLLAVTGFGAFLLNTKGVQSSFFIVQEPLVYLKSTLMLLLSIAGVVLISVITLGLFQTKLSVGRMATYKRTFVEPLILFFLSLGVAFFWFRSIAHVTAQTLLAISTQPPLSVLTAILNVTLYSLLALSIGMIFGGILLSRIYFNMQVKNYQHSMRRAHHNR